MCSSDLLSRDRLPWPPPLLPAADWRRLRSRHVRLLCCGLGDGVCLREEETEEEEGEGEEEEGGAERPLHAHTQTLPGIAARPLAPRCSAPPPRGPTLFSQDAGVPGPLPPRPRCGAGLARPRREVRERAAAPQYEVVPAARGRGAAAAAPAAGRALREPRGRRGRASRLFFCSREDAAGARR